MALSSCRVARLRYQMASCFPPHAGSVKPAYCYVQEAGAAWIRRMHADPAYTATFQLYMDTLPTTEEVLSPEMWTQDMVAALQCPELVRRL